MTILGLVLLAASIYFFFVYGKSTKAENEVRHLFQKALGVNALPRYLNRVTAMTLRNRAVKMMKAQLAVEELDWIELAEQKKYDRDLLPPLFAAMGYHCVIEKKERFCKLYDELKSEFMQLAATETAAQ